MAPYGVRWRQMVSDGVRLRRMVSDGVGLSQMVSDGVSSPGIKGLKLLFTLLLPRGYSTLQLCHFLLRHSQLLLERRLGAQP